MIESFEDLADVRHRLPVLFNQAGIVEWCGRCCKVIRVIAWRREGRLRNRWLRGHGYLTRVFQPQ